MRGARVVCFPGRRSELMSAYSEAAGVGGLSQSLIEMEDGIEGGCVGGRGAPSLPIAFRRMVAYGFNSWLILFCYACLVARCLHVS